MPYYNVCKVCGCNLDPGEVCDCQNATEHKKSTPDTINTESALSRQESVKFPVQQLHLQYITEKAKCQ